MREKAGDTRIFTRVRVNSYTNVHVVAELSDGSVWSDQAEAKVTIGGCGG